MSIKGEKERMKRTFFCRAVARSENLGGHVILGGDNLPPLVEIGLTDLTKSGGGTSPPACDGPGDYYIRMNFFKFLTFIWVHILKKNIWVQPLYEFFFSGTFLTTG